MTDSKTAERKKLSVIPGRICFWLVMTLYPAIPFNNAIRANALSWANRPD